MRVGGYRLEFSFAPSEAEIVGAWVPQYVAACERGEPSVPLPVPPPVPCNRPVAELGEYVWTVEASALQDQHEGFYARNRAYWQTRNKP